MTREAQMRIAGENPRSIDLHVGPFIYRLVVSDREILDEEGCSLEAVAVESQRLLILSVSLDIDRREELAGHEFVHAWEFHVPKPTTAEERCQFFAMVSQQFRQDIEAQGGAESIRALEPIYIPHRGAKHTAAVRQHIRRATWAGFPGRCRPAFGKVVRCGK